MDQQEMIEEQHYLWLKVIKARVRRDQFEAQYKVKVSTKLENALLQFSHHHTCTNHTQQYNDLAHFYKEEVDNLCLLKQVLRSSHMMQEP